MPTDNQVNDLKINVLSEAQYEQIQSPSSTELYLVPETVDTTPTSGSTNPITSGGVYNALQNIPSQEQSDWNETDATDPAYIKNKPQNIVTDANYVHTDNNYTTTEKSKLADIEAGAEANVQSDWNQTNSSADDFIKNKPDLDATLYEEVTYAQLRTKIDNEQLVEGKKYRITDYVTLLDSGDNPSVSSSYKYKSAQHPFDLVVTATSASTLDCCAQAVLHDGDTYFNAEKLSKLKIWYSVIGNDVEYAHPYNGKGCIYRMVDEFGNDCPYDFHNVMFKRKVNNGVYDEQSGTLTWLYTFDSGFGADVSFNAQFGNNVIKPHIVDDEGGNMHKLMDGTVFLGGGWYNNTIGFRCIEVTISDTCSSNNIGNDCNDIVLINSSDNVIGAYVTASRISNLQKSDIGPSCGNLNIGSASSQTYFYNIIVAGGNNSLSLAGDGNGSVYYVYVEQGVSGTVTLAGGLSYGMRVGKQSDGSIRIYNEDDPQVQANWNETNSSSPSYIQHKPNLAPVATSGSYNDLSNKPTIPTVPTHRTVNHEQITDSSLGDANLHDGFYFPNAVQDYDGNWYGAVVIGDQVWLGENLRTTHYADGTEIPKASTASSSAAVYLDNSSSPIPLEKRGYHYNYLAFSRDDETSEISSMTQGIAPNGWHIPTYNETQILKSYLNRQNRHKYNNTDNYIAKSIASTDYWGTSETVGAVGYDKGSNNSSGFNAFPCGVTASNSFSSNTTTIWSGRNAAVGIKPMIISASSTTITTTTSYGAVWACSVRCVSNLTPLQFRDWYVNQYGTLQHNVLSSELSAGRDIAIFPKSNYLPTGYEELEYIEATGTQYINTNVYPAPNVQTNLKIGKTANTFTKFGSFAAAGSNYQVLLSTTIANNYYCSLWSSSVNFQYIVSTLDTFTIKFNKPGSKFSIDNNADVQLTPMTPMNTSNPIGIFSFRGSSSSSTAIGRVYYIEIFNNETNEMLFKGIPARRTSDGSVGFYDTVTNTLFTNVGTGSFITGPVIAMNDKDTIVFTNESGYAILPSMSGNSGKVLAVNSGETGVEWVRPVTVYSGSSEPSASLGSDGDIFILAS